MAVAFPPPASVLVNNHTRHVQAVIGCQEVLASSQLRPGPPSEGFLLVLEGSPALTLTLALALTLRFPFLPFSEQRKHTQVQQPAD